MATALTLTFVRSLANQSEKLRLLRSPLLVASYQAQSYSTSVASVTRTKRTHYPRTYPTLLVFPDGSTINIRYHEPRRIIALPLDFSTLTEAERRRVLANRKPKQKLEVIEDFEETFSVDDYTKYWKK